MRGKCVKFKRSQKNGLLEQISPVERDGLEGTRTDFSKKKSQRDSKKQLFDLSTIGKIISISLKSFFFLFEVKKWKKNQYMIK
jgi:hypothetical protein